MLNENHTINGRLNTFSTTKGQFITHGQFVNLNNLNKLAMYRCDFNSRNYRDNLFDDFNIELPSALINSVTKRRAEFLAGRYAAASALQSYGMGASKIGIGKHRSPTWPEGIVASITHSNSSAVCAVANQNDISYLGIDLENWLTHNIIQEIKSSVIQNVEEKLLQKSSIGFEKAFVLTFSAKESLFKALYPSVGFYFDFNAAEVTNISIKQKTFDLILRESLTPKFTSGTRFSGHFDFDSSSILTLIAGYVFKS